MASASDSGTSDSGPRPEQRAELPPFQRYLEAKRTVDDRALDRAVWSELVERAAQLTAGRGAGLDVLELGAGTGSMVARLLAEEENARFSVARYLAVDEDAASLSLLTDRFTDPRVRIERRDLFELLAEESAQHDLVVACAVLDLLPAAEVVAAIVPRLRPGGLLYLPIHFDGQTIFEPEIDPELDAAIERLYHRTMDRRLREGKPSGHSRTGRRLPGIVREVGLELLAVGSSDWVVWGDPRTGTYPDDEAYFLGFILDTVRSALAGDVERGELAREQLDHWHAQRCAQVARGELVYVAHQLDVLARKPAR